MSSSNNKPAGMKLRRVTMFAAGATACALAGTAAAQSSSASSTEIVLPMVVNISVYKTKVFVLNPNPGPIAVNVLYYQSKDGTAPTGFRPCTQLNMQGNQSATFDLGTQCGLTGSNDDFGMLFLQDAAQTNEFFAYSRTETSAGIGFSVEGFPIENFSGETAHVLGLQTTAAAPNYRSNCFVSSFADPVNWQLQLVQGGTETVLGTISGHLDPLQTTRILDVFAAAGLAGDYGNVRATFSTTDVSQPTYMGFCTLETSSNGSADFRIAKSLTPLPPAPTPLTTPTATWSGPMVTLNANQASYIFMGPTASVVAASASNLSAFGSGWFSRNTPGAATLSVGVCYQNQAGPGPVTVMPTPSAPSVSNTDVPVLVTGTAAVAAGTYNVGLCALNNNNVSINKNGNTAGFAFVTP